MDDTSESTRTSKIDWTPESRQGAINYYANELMARLIENPFESIPDPLEFLQRGGPRPDENELIHLFAGRSILLRTCRRMNIIRRAALQGVLESLPIDLGNWGGRRPLGDGSTRDEYTDWRAPHLDGQDLFWRSIPNMEQDIPRRPTNADADDYFATPADDRSMETSGESDGWIQMLMPQDWYYEPDPDTNLPYEADSNMDISLGSDMEVD